MNRLLFKRKIVQLEAVVNRLARTTSVAQRRDIKRAQGVIIKTLDELLAESLKVDSINLIAKRIELTNVIRKEMTNLSITQKTTVDKVLTSIYKTNYTEISKMLGNSFNVVSDQQVKALMNVGIGGKPYSTRIYSNNTIVGERINRDITKLLFNKADPTDIKQAIRKDLNISWNSADRLVRTEASRFYNSAALDSYKDAGLEEVEWLTEQDDLTCEICGPLNGQRFPINDSMLPPNDSHANCRCTVLPVL